MVAFTAKDIARLFEALNEELRKQGIQGELDLVGGAVMCLVHKTRPATKDIDGYFQPAAKIRQAAKRVALQLNIAEDWLNDAVKGFLSDKGNFSKFLQLSHLNVYTARADYLLAMKCLAMRIGEEFHDLDDVRFLLRYLNIETYHQAIALIETYYPVDRIPQKTLYVLEEMLEG